MSYKYLALSLYNPNYGTADFPPQAWDEVFSELLDCGAIFEQENKPPNIRLYRYDFTVNSFHCHRMKNGMLHLAWRPLELPTSNWLDTCLVIECLIKHYQATDWFLPSRTLPLNLPPVGSVQWYL